MFELARIMGTSAKMIEQHYGTLIDTAHDGILARLEAMEVADFQLRAYVDRRCACRAEVARLGRSARAVGRRARNER